MASAHDNTGTQLLTIKELSVLCRLSLPTLHRLKRDGKIPFYQPAGKGGRLLFPSDAIERATKAVGLPAAHPSGSQEAPPHLSGPVPSWLKAVNTQLKDTCDVP